MRLHCPHCGRQIPSDNLNIATAIAKCSDCSAVFGFSDALEQDGSRRPQAAKQRNPVPLPAGISIDDRGGNRRLVRKWYSLKYFFLLFFCIMWNAFLIVWYGIAFSQDEVLWMMVLFPVLHVVIGLALAYFTLCGFVNRTVIEFGGYQLSIQHKPLPWPGNRIIEANQIEQLFCRERVRHGKNGTSTTYELHAITKDGKKLKLLSGLFEADHVVYLEQEIEHALNISNRPVRGEYA
ncbi:MAG: hypothetical protein GXP29_01850 [Planctomycetes bacterium]|nr:hypothetical protein [Planctomycetota bacterium]